MFPMQWPLIAPSHPACSLAIAAWLACKCFLAFACYKPFLGIPSVLHAASFTVSTCGQTRAFCSKLCSSLAQYSGILHTEPLLQHYRGYPCTSVQLCRLLSKGLAQNSCSRRGEQSRGAIQRTNQSKKGPRKRIPAPPRLTGACAREQASPRATDRPPARRRGGRAAQVSPRRVNAAAKYTVRTFPRRPWPRSPIGPRYRPRRRRAGRGSLVFACSEIKLSMERARCRTRTWPRRSSPAGPASFM